MKLDLKVLSIVCIVLGGFAVISGLADPYPDGIYAIFGGGLFLAEGIIALIYMKGK